MTSDPEIIQKMISVMERNRSTIENDISTLVFYMQGGLDYNDAWLLTLSQRKNMSSIIEKHYSAMSGNKKQML
jgi:hypothetical protein